jgi:hypothetical protein
MSKKLKKNFKLNFKIFPTSSGNYNNIPDCVKDLFHVYNDSKNNYEDFKYHCEKLIKSRISKINK